MIAFIVGCVFSGTIGFCGMWLAVRGNVRTAAAARESNFSAALQVAFRTGGVAGLSPPGSACSAPPSIIMIFQNTASSILVGFGFGGSLLALFLRVGGGIFTKAADVGADLVGKVEAGIPEDDPRNPATIADNVGDNVGDCAGMAADLFESFAVTLVASIILGVSAFRAIGLSGGHEAAKGLIFPLAVVSIGLLASMVGIFVVRGRPGETDALKAINRGIYTAQAIAILGAAVVAFVYVGNPAGSRLSNPGARLFGAIVTGVVLGFAASRITEYYTSTKRNPVQAIARAARTGPATTVLEGISSVLVRGVGADRRSRSPSAPHSSSAAETSGSPSTWSPSPVSACWRRRASSWPRTPSVRWPTTPPASPRWQASSRASRSGSWSASTRWQHHEGSDQGLRHRLHRHRRGRAFSSYVETIAKGTLSAATVLAAEASGTLASLVKIDVADPKTFIGLFVGRSVAFLFSSLAVRAVSRTAGTIVEEVRRQFREKPGIIDRAERPDYGAVIDICTTASLPRAGHAHAAGGADPGDHRLRDRLPRARRLPRRRHRHRPAHGQLLVELGRRLGQRQEVHRGRPRGRQGSETHKAAVIGDTVGDPFKDTAGPALDPLIKVMNLVSLLDAAGHPHAARQRRPLPHRRRRPRGRCSAPSPTPRRRGAPASRPRTAPVHPVASEV